jgi:hypothetical protein
MKKLILPIILINITVSANTWNVFGFNLGQLLYWTLLILAWLLLQHSIFKLRSSILILLLFFSKFFFLISNNEFAWFIGETLSGLIFVLLGAFVFGNERVLLMRQLLWYLALSIPFLIFQKTGLHDFFYGWSTELFHENGVYEFDDIKETGRLFKGLTLYQTLFVAKENLTYVMYQARPTGLSYSNNVLSVILVTAIALSLYIKNKKLNFLSDFVLPFISVLVMSTLVYTVILLFILFYKKSSLFKINLIVCLFLHYVFFPGLTASSFGLINALSFISRFGEIFQLLGFSDFVEMSTSLITNDANVNLDFSDTSYSLYGKILRFQYWYLFLPIIFILFYYFLKKVRLLKSHLNFDSKPYIILLVILILTQIAVPFIRAPFFQIFLGLSFYPFVSLNISNDKNQLLEIRSYL